MAADDAHVLAVALCHDRGVDVKHHDDAAQLVGLGAQGRPGLCRELVDDGRRGPEVTGEGGVEPSELLDLVGTKLLDAVATKLDREALGEQARAFAGQLDVMGGANLLQNGVEDPLAGKSARVDGSPSKVKVVLVLADMANRLRDELPKGDGAALQTVEGLEQALYHARPVGGVRLAGGALLAAQQNVVVLLGGGGTEHGGWEVIGPDDELVLASGNVGMRAAVDDAALEAVDVLGEVCLDERAQGAAADAHVGRDAATLGAQEVHRKVNPLAHAALGKRRNADHDGNDASKGAGLRGACRSRAAQNQTGPLAGLCAGNGATVLPKQGDHQIALARAQRVNAVKEDAPSPDPFQDAGCGGVAKETGLQARKVGGIRGTVNARVGSLGRNDSPVVAILKGQTREAGLSAPALAAKQNGQTVGRIAHRRLELINARGQREVVADGLLKVLGLSHANALEQGRHGRILACRKTVLEEVLEGSLVKVDDRTGVHLDDEAVADQLIEILAGETARYVDVRRNPHGREGTDRFRSRRTSEPIEVLKKLLLCA